MAGNKIDRRSVASHSWIGIEIRRAGRSALPPAGRKPGNPPSESSRISSRYFPFHSAQRVPRGKDDPPDKVLLRPRPPRSAFTLPKNGIPRQILQKRRLAHRRAILISSQNTGQIETEAIHMIFDGPVAQALQNHLLHHRMIAVQRIAAAAEIIVDSRPGSAYNKSDYQSL